MIYRRNEAFRFSFGDPLKGNLKILTINGVSRNSGEGSVMILDLSPNGLKIVSPLEFPIEDKIFLMEITFILNQKNIAMLAQPKWRKQVGQSSFTYGLVGMDNEETKREIIEELKEYSRRINRDKKNASNNN